MALHRLLVALLTLSTLLRWAPVPRPVVAIHANCEKDRNHFVVHSWRGRPQKQMSSAYGNASSMTDEQADCPVHYGAAALGHHSPFLPAPQALLGSGGATADLGPAGAASVASGASGLFQQCDSSGTPYCAWAPTEDDDSGGCTRHFCVCRLWEQCFRKDTESGVDVGECGVSIFTEVLLSLLIFALALLFVVVARLSLLSQQLYEEALAKAELEDRTWSASTPRTASAPSAPLADAAAPSGERGGEPASSCAGAATKAAPAGPEESF